MNWIKSKYGLTMWLTGALVVVGLAAYAGAVKGEPVAVTRPDSGSPS